MSDVSRQFQPPQNGLGFGVFAPQDEELRRLGHHQSTSDGLEKRFYIKNFCTLFLRFLYLKDPDERTQAEHVTPAVLDVGENVIDQKGE